MDIKIKTSETGTTNVLLNGDEVSQYLYGFTLEVGPGYPPKRTLTLSIGPQVDVDVDLDRVQVGVDGSLSVQGTRAPDRTTPSTDADRLRAERLEALRVAGVDL